jgi:magnesium-transporting ATPase (P-type)
LPAHEFNVLPKPKINLIRQHLVKKNSNITTVKTNESSSVWTWKIIISILSIVFVMLMVLVWVVWRLSSSQIILRQVKHACFTNNPYKAQEAILQWARMQWPNLIFLNLSDVINTVDNLPLKEQLNNLLQILYAPKNIKNSWSGALLWHNIKQFKHKRKTAFHEPLQPLL